ncbi:GCN5-related N-acetyltransferase [uncultured Woeseiaceae bacterium]|uniref:GCN5-related N-acetyltransferase n=1 Tax=uncultured Woeseiaceae bacterium TaxID=1983305 RepID=A0A7D9H3R0_9GAMM|nr:GCN5-related N-acetyltransferase [uncultured Woeseiaceae bacterium]
MKIVFRTDATRQIGTGHFMRCFTLADELKKQGAEVLFISRNLPGHLSDMLDAKGMAYALLSMDAAQESSDDLAHSNWLSTTQDRDAQATILALADHSWDWVIVDHYALDARWESAVRASAKQLMVIDDLADRRHDCDVLLDQNFYADMQRRYIGKVPVHCQLLLGPRYALLREEFKKLRTQIKPCAGEVKKILVFFGGIDADNYTSLAVEALASMNNGLHVDVVIGAQHPYHDQIQNACIAHGYECHIQTTRMAELMVEADLSIGAGGTAMWERCCLGLPTISLCAAENQRKQIVDAAEAGLLYAPISGKNLVNTIRHHTNVLLENPALLKLISNAEMKAVDGKGVKRIVSAMAIPGIEIRQATEHDSKNLFEWRNHTTIRAVSRNNSPIVWEDHQRWFGVVMDDKACELLIGISANQPVGVVRFDREGDIVEVSIYIVPDGEFLGQGRNLLLCAELWLKANRPDIKSIRASVLGENEASKNLFLGSSYRTHMICYQKDL